MLVISILTIQFVNHISIFHWVWLASSGQCHWTQAVSFFISELIIETKMTVTLKCKD